MRKNLHPTLMLGTASLLASCGAPLAAPASGTLPLEAEAARLEGAPGLGTLALVEPGRGTNARVIGDPAASGGKAVGLFSTGSAVTFSVPGTLAAGRYTVRVQARAQAYLGQPVVALRREGQELGRVELPSPTYRASVLGSFDLRPGDRLSVVFLNDANGGSPARDRNAVVDYLLIDPAAGTSAPARSSTPSPATGLRLPPGGRVPWDYQLGAGGDANVVVPGGVRLVSIDGFDISAGKVAELRGQGVYPLCYINVGSYEPWRPDAAQYPASLKVQQDPDWPDESFLDVTDVFRPGSVLATILRGRFRMCRDKGFPAVEPDNLQNDQTVSGGRITTQQQLDFNGWVADLAHEYGLAIFQKNGPDKVLLRDRTGKMMVEKFDGILNEECQRYNECAPLAEYTRRGKPALNVEYTGTLDCTLAAKLGISMIRKDLALKGRSAPGYVRQSCD